MMNIRMVEPKNDEECIENENYDDDDDEDCCCWCTTQYTDHKFLQSSRFHIRKIVKTFFFSPIFVRK
jgi:hypothetical protein